MDLLGARAAEGCAAGQVRATSTPDAEEQLTEPGPRSTQRASHQPGRRLTLRDGWEVSTAYRLASGAPFTPILSGLDDGQGGWPPPGSDFATVGTQL